MEYRAITEVRAVEQEDQGMVIEGVVNNIGQWSKPIGGVFRERILPGVFQKAITRAAENNGDIFFLHQHDSRALPLGSINSGTLELKEADDKLTMRAVLPDTSFSRDIYALVKSGVLREFSFGFSKPRSTWTMGNDNVKERSVTDFNLHEISIVRTGAYDQTKAHARALEEAEAELRDNQDQDQDKIKDMEYKLKLAKTRVI